MMHNVNVEAVEATATLAATDPSSVIQKVGLEGDWQTAAGQPQFRTEIALPGGQSVPFEADYPPHMGGSGSAPNPLAYCFWGGLACYAMTYAQEAAREGIELRSLHARVEAKVDMSRALGVGENPPVDRIDWYLEVDADATPEALEAIKEISDYRCPGAWCIRNPVDLHTHLAICPAD